MKILAVVHPEILYELSCRFAGDNCQSFHQKLTNIFVQVFQFIRYFTSFKSGMQVSFDSNHAAGDIVLEGLALAFTNTFRGNKFLLKRKIFKNWGFQLQR